MSLLLNLFQGNGPYDLKDMHLVDAESGLDRSQSQTTEARIYSFATTNGVKVRILDTPGLADTRGIQEDKRHKAKIVRAIQDFIKVIDGVMIVANGRVERLTVATDYTLNILATLFPRSIVDNIGIIFTNIGCGGSGLNFQTESLPPELQDVDFWYLDNPLSLYKNYSTKKAANGFRRGQESKQRQSIENCYRDAIENLDDWLAWLDERQPIPTASILELYQKSSHIELRLYSTITSIDNLSKLETQLLDISTDLKVVGKQTKRLEILEVQQPTKVWMLQETSDFNTMCTFPSCHSNCHRVCSLELGDTTTIGGTCQAFKTLWIPNQWLPFWSNDEVKCGVCGHEARAHRHYQSIHQKTINDAYKRIIQDLQAATTEQERLEGVKTRIEQEIKIVKRDIELSKRDIPRLIAELNRLSLSPNYADYISSALDLLKMKKEQLLSSPDPGNDLEMINEGIKALEAQLELLRENIAGRFVETSGEQVGS
ncbi:hypothetical protein FRC11_001132 [Ceratobasidium sp. 423]|nr:hypothetical protein FRC11_001132 [Ceratobasidium sp. 423]